MDLNSCLIDQMGYTVCDACWRRISESLQPTPTQAGFSNKKRPGLKFDPSAGTASPGEFAICRYIARQDGLLCPRMGVIVHLGNLCGGELRITLRGREAFMAEQLLNGAEVGAFF